MAADTLELDCVSASGPPISVFFLPLEKFYEFSYQFKRRETAEIYVLKVASCHNDEPIYMGVSVCVC